jgi:DtxR family manganese transport transcriptional regulator
VARRLGVSHATAIKTISRLKREGLATGRPYRGVFLTDIGQALAERTRARHRVVVNLLVALGVPAEIAEADAEGIEHHVSEATLKAFAHFLQTPRPGRTPRKASNPGRPASGQALPWNKSAPPTRSG